MCPDRQEGERGFTLIEALVALTILSAVMIGFFDFLSGALNGARRMEAASIAYDHRTNALEIATAVNPMDLPEGNLDLGRYHIKWTSKLLGDIRQSSGYPGGSGIFKVALYRMTFVFPDDADVPPIEVTKLGYHRDNVPDMVPGGTTGPAASAGQ
jgi:general secretion pathway protein I